MKNAFAKSSTSSTILGVPGVHFFELHLHETNKMNSKIEIRVVYTMRSSFLECILKKTACNYISFRPTHCFWGRGGNSIKAKKWHQPSGKLTLKIADNITHEHVQKHCCVISRCLPDAHYYADGAPRSSDMPLGGLSLSPCACFLRRCR